MLRTKSGLPKHCCWNADQFGNRYVRFRKGAVSVYLKNGIPWSEDFMKEYAAALQAATPQAGNTGAERTLPGSFNALVVSYYRSSDFHNLRSSTQRMRRYIIESFRKEHGDKPIAKLKREYVQAIIGKKANTPGAANNLLKALRLLLNYAVENEMIPSNPAIGVKRYRSHNPDGIRTWTEGEVVQFTKRHPVGTMAHLAMMLMLCTGQRRSDVRVMGWQHIRNNETIAVRQQKTNTPLIIPIHPDLQEALKSTARTNMTFLVTEFGKPFVAAGFGNWIRRKCDEAGLPQCSAHGLRKLAATRLADVGCSEREIMAITGHKSASEVSRYTMERDQARLAQQAMAKLVTAQKNKQG
jgi:integrase